MRRTPTAWPALDLIATTNAGGASRWDSALSQALRGRHVIVVPDNDEAGRRHAATVAELAPRDRRNAFGCLHLPGLPPKGDVSDWLDSGGTD